MHSLAVAKIRSEPSRQTPSPRPAIRSVKTNPPVPAAPITESQPSGDALAGENGAPSVSDNHAKNSPILPDPVIDDQYGRATPLARVIDGDGGAHPRCESRTLDSPIVAEITQLWRMRQRWHRAEKSLTLQGKAICRAWTEGDKVAADKLFDNPQDNDPPLTVALAPFRDAIAQFDPQRRAVEKHLKKLAKSLPIAKWIPRGFGELNLAAIIGECGEIAGYRNPSCLWKRMGLAVIDGGRQRKVADAEQAIVHGYNPQRRAVAFLLGDCLIRAKSPYKAVYDARKLIELAKEEMTPIHAHRRAARYMVKRVLRDMWIEARKGTGAHTTRVNQYVASPDADP